MRSFRSTIPATGHIPERCSNSINFEDNSDDFVFDNEMLSQILYAGFEIAEITCPTKYFAEASSINFSRSLKYGFGVFKSIDRTFPSTHWLDPFESLQGQEKGCRLKIRIRRVLAFVGILSLVLYFSLSWFNLLADPDQRTGSDFMGVYVFGRITQTVGIQHLYEIAEHQEIEEQVVGHPVTPIFYTHLPFMAPSRRRNCESGLFGFLQTMGSALITA